MSVTLTLGFLLAASPAQAGSCDHLLSKADSAKGAALATAYSSLAKCDQKLAEEHYVRFMANATDSEALVALSKAGIRWETWNPATAPPANRLATCRSNWRSTKAFRQGRTCTSSGASTD